MIRKKINKEASTEKDFDHDAWDKELLQMVRSKHASKPKEKTVKSPEERELKEKFYTSPKAFKQLLINYYKTDILPDELAINIVKIAEGLSYNWRFVSYTQAWKDEMVGDAKLKMFAALLHKKFKMDVKSDWHKGELTSPFSYFTQIAWHSFCNRVKKEKKQHEGLQEYKQMKYEDLMNEPGGQGNIYVRPMMESDENDECGD